MALAGFMAVFAYVDIVAGVADCRSGVVVVTEGCCALLGVEITAGVEGDSCEGDGGDCDLFSSVVFTDDEDGCDDGGDDGSGN